MLYYIIIAGISVGVDIVLYKVYKWLNVDQQICLLHLPY